MTADGEPRRLDGAGVAGDAAFSMVLSRSKPGQLHLALGRRDVGQDRVLHLGWHRVLRDQPLEELLAGDTARIPCVVVTLWLDPAVETLLRVLSKRIATRYGSGLQGPAYGFGNANALFDQTTAELDDPDAAFTCATFVLQVLRSAGVQLLDPTRWRQPTEEDLAWQLQIGARLVAWIEQVVQGDLAATQQRIEHDRSALRFRPSDVAGSARIDPALRPASAAEVDPHAAHLESLL